MRFIAISILAGVLASGCEDDGATSGDDNGDSSEARALVTEFVAEYDRRIRTQCPCQVEQGAYPTVEQCVELLGSGPSWVDCATTAIEPYDTPELRETGRCLIEQIKARNDCYPGTQCGSDARVACDTLQSGCAMIDPRFVILISQQCPDTTILGTRL